MQQRRNEWARETEDPEKTRRPAASSETIPTCENPGVTRPGIEPRGEQANRSATAAPCRTEKGCFETRLLTASLYAGTLNCGLFTRLTKRDVSSNNCGAAVTTRLPPRRTGFDSRWGRFPDGNRAGRCHWSAGFLGDLPFPPTLAFRRCSIPRFTRISSQDLDVKSRPNLCSSIHSPITVAERLSGQDLSRLISNFPPGRQDGRTRVVYKRAGATTRDDLSVRERTCFCAGLYARWTIWRMIDLTGARLKRASGRQRDFDAPTRLSYWRSTRTHIAQLTYSTFIPTNLKPEIRLPGLRFGRTDVTVTLLFIGSYSNFVATGMSCRIRRDSRKTYHASKPNTYCRIRAHLRFQMDRLQVGRKSCLEGLCNLSHFGYRNLGIRANSSSFSSFPRNLTVKADRVESQVRVPHARRTRTAGVVRPPRHVRSAADRLSIVHRVVDPRCVLLLCSPLTPSYPELQPHLVTDTAPGIAKDGGSES
ncbi:hypothetical protein PR048_009515 [Dryococelus australis]|uniref:Uncharacterized protein n=1 Tax=Dryococelus australis TaxID=614101 RepID=A0ABQ9I061_9NEOP|nr:hypothetical protein PR048_009515 [Dryococelus australis]